MEGGKRSKVKRYTLARLIADAVRKIPNAVGWSLVKHDGRMMVKVEVKESEACRESSS